MDKNQSTKAVQTSLASGHPKTKSVQSKARSRQAGIEQKILNTYIGHNYQKITARSYNFAAFFLQGFYLLYRRMFLAGITLILAEFAIYGFVGMFSNYQTASWVYTAIYIVVGIILCFTFNKFYTFHARRKINLIRRRNPTLDDTGILSVCSENHSTSYFMTFGGIILTFTIMIIVNIICLTAGIPSPFATNTPTNSVDPTTTTNNAEQPNDPSSNSTIDNYTGSIEYNTAINIADEFSLQIPDEFIDNSSVYRFQFDYSLDQTDANQCEFALGVVQDFTSAQKLIDQIANFNTNTPATVQTSVIDNQQWYWISEDNSLFGVKYTYATDKNNNIYLMTYQEPNNDQAPECAKFHQAIISSLKFN